jgi:hypothetical protein
VDALGSAPRASSAYRCLLNRGQAAVPAIRAGLRHLDPAVREQCCRLLDLDHPGNPRGCETWEDAGSWWHSGSIRRSCVNAR